jgi:hypothetical protein
MVRHTSRRSRFVLGTNRSYSIRPSKMASLRSHLKSASTSRLYGKNDFKIANHQNTSLHQKKNNRLKYTSNHYQHRAINHSLVLLVCKKSAPRGPFFQPWHLENAINKLLAVKYSVKSKWKIKSSKSGLGQIILSWVKLGKNRSS